MCSSLGVSRSRYYEWREQLPTVRSQENKMLSDKIKDIFDSSRQNYGARRIKYLLARENLIISRRRIGRLMLQMSLHCKTKKKFRITTDSNHKLPIAENILNREFLVKKPDKYYVGDITYIHTLEGWLYLSVVIDLFSRKIIGWAMNDNMRVELANNALLMALWQRKPSRGLLWHTDRGSQYAADEHKKILKEYGITQSMSRRGNCWDNAVSESFFHTLKTELTHHIKFRTKEEAKQTIFEYIEVFYNKKRIHSANNYLSPEEFEMAHISH